MQFIQTIPADNPRKHVFIGIGAGDGTLEALCVAALFASGPLLRAAGLTVSLCIEAGNCHVDDMRNGIVTSFIESEADELVFIDEDVGFQAEDLLKLIQHDRDVVAGVYPKKEDEPNFPVYVNGGTELWADRDGLVEVHGVPTGFLKIKRRVIEELAKDAVCYTGNDGRDYHVVFERIVMDGKRWSGDYGFCRKWIARGGQVFVDPAFTLTHTGKKVWMGELGAHWRKAHGLEGQHRAQQLAWGVASLREGHASPEVFKALCYGWNNEWAAQPEMLADIWDRAGGGVLECGSGLTTLVLALHPGVKLTVLEHDPAFASHTAQMLGLFGLEADIRVTPLKDGWYDFAGGAYDTVIVDGPPRAVGDRAVAMQRCTAKLFIVDDVGGEPRHRIYDGAKLPELEPA